MGKKLWPQLAYVKHLLSVENKLEECLQKIYDDAKRLRRASSAGSDATKTLHATVVHNPVHYPPESKIDATSDSDEEDVLTTTPTSPPLNMRHRFSLDTPESEEQEYRPPKAGYAGYGAPKSMQNLRDETRRLRQENEQLKKQLKQLLENR